MQRGDAVSDVQQQDQNVREDLFFVVKNHKDEYSIWFADIEIPDGWEPLGDPRPKAQCLAWIDENWTGLASASAYDNAPQGAK
jgi:MbtH protein